MALYRFADRIPKVAAGAWVSDSARVIGDVEIAAGCYVGHGAILRGDYGSIRIGPGSAIEEGVIVHIRPEGLNQLGERVTVGHGAVLHGDRIDDYAVIGMGAVISFASHIGRWAIVAEGGVVTAGSVIPAETVAHGVPARPAGPVQQRHKDFWTYGKQLYVDLAARYPQDYERID